MAGLGSHFGGISRALSNRDYRVYWSGQVLSVQGVWINRVAGGLLILELTGSYTWLGTIGFLHLIPIFLFGPLGGALADRFGHRRMAMISMSIGGALVFLLTYLTFIGQMTAVTLAVLTGIIGVATAFEFPARQAFIPRLVR
ncbi:MAG: MFS transporter, partial [Proteobacteria bacterium]|nr:MFS transporter [Pseudomonadota bacterium]